MALPRLLTISEVASLTRAPISTVSFWIYSGKLKAHKVGRRRLVAEPDLVAFVMPAAQHASPPRAKTRHARPDTSTRRGAR